MISLQHIVFGFLVGFVGIIPPGLLNLTAAKIRMSKSFESAIYFIVGACIVVVGQVYLGVFFSRLITENDLVLQIMERFSVIVFLAISIFFFVKAVRYIEPAKAKIDDKTSGAKMIGQGMLLSVLNIFPVPFYIGFSSFLASRGLFKYQFPHAHLFIISAAMGTFVMMFLYARFIEKLGFSSTKFAKNTNYVIGVLTLSIAIFTAIRTF